MTTVNSFNMLIRVFIRYCILKKNLSCYTLSKLALTIIENILVILLGDLEGDTGHDNVDTSHLEFV